MMTPQMDIASPSTANLWRCTATSVPVGIRVPQCPEQPFWPVFGAAVLDLVRTGARPLPQRAAACNSLTTFHDRSLHVATSSYLTPMSCKSRQLFTQGA